MTRRRRREEAREEARRKRAEEERIRQEAEAQAAAEEAARVEAEAAAQQVGSPQCLLPIQLGVCCPFSLGSAAPTVWGLLPLNVCCLFEQSPYDICNRNYSSSVVTSSAVPQCLDMSDLPYASRLGGVALQDCQRCCCMHGFYRENSG